MKKFFFLLPLAIVFISLLASFMWWNNAKSAPSTDSTQERFLIKKGASADTIGKNLESEGLIKSSFAFKIYIQSRGSTKNIPPGEFSLPGNLTLPQIVDKLLEGPTEIWVTVPEGLRREEVVEEFIENLNLAGEEAVSFRQGFLMATSSEEGFLFPDTYLVPKDVSPTIAVSLMKNTFEQKFEVPYSAAISSSGYSLREIVTLASIIERETITDEERPVVAGIYFNRLSLGMPIQADATVQYALGDVSDWWPNVTRDDLSSTKSPYSTYVNSGIPAGPIANPGLSSLIAVVEPRDSDYLYYLHDSDGIIHYAEDLDGHNANIVRYLR